METTYDLAIADPDSIEDRIRERAQELYRMRQGEPCGTDLEDWLQAEREVLAHESKNSQ